MAKRIDDVRIGFPSAGVEKPLYADVSALADAAADLPITSPLTEGIMDIVNAADDWLELARKTVAKRNSGQKLGKCLQWMLCSLDRALEQFTLRLQVSVNQAHGLQLTHTRLSAVDYLKTVTYILALNAVEGATSRAIFVQNCWENKCAQDLTSKSFTCNTSGAQGMRSMCIMYRTRSGCM